MCVLFRCVSLEGNSLFLRDVSGPEEPLHTLITHTRCVSNWVSAELVICDSVKVIPQIMVVYELNWVMNVHNTIVLKEDY